MVPPASDRTLWEIGTPSSISRCKTYYVKGRENPVTMSQLIVKITIY